MRKAHVRLVLLIILAAVAIALVLVNTGAVLSMGSARDPGRSALLQQVTPTTAVIDASQPGSTTGIEWMGVLIVVIILAPIVFRKGTWSRT